MLDPDKPWGYPDAGGSEAGFDEATYAHPVAPHLGTDHTEVALTAADAQVLIPSLPPCGSSWPAPSPSCP